MSNAGTRGRRDKVRLQDIAREANLSVSTVSMALSDHPGISRETKIRIRRLSRSLGYDRPRQRQPSIAGKRLGFVLIGGKFDDEANAPALQAVADRTRRADARLEATSLEIASPDELRRALLDFTKDLDGVMVTGQITTELLIALRETQIACVLLGHFLDDERYSPPPYGHMVCCNEVRMGQMATAALMSAGHTRIAFVCETMPRGLWMSQWYNGYRLVHLDRDMPIDPKLTHVAGKAFAGGDSAAELFTSMSNPPTGFVVPDVRITASFVRAMRRRGAAVQRNQVVMGGQTFLRARYELNDYPLVSVDIARQAEVGFELLTRELREGVQGDINLVMEPEICDLPTG